MVDDNTDVSGNKRRGVSRRRFVQAAGATGAASTIAVSGCLGGGDSGDGAVTIYSDDDMKEHEDTIQSVLEEVGVEEEIEVIEGHENTDDRRNKISTAFQGQQDNWDIISADNGWTKPFIAGGHLANLSDHLPSDALDTVDNDYFQSFTSTARDLDGNLFGVPLYPDYPTMQYRKDLFEDAGYNPDEEGWATDPPSMEEFSHIVADVHDNVDVDYGYTFQASAYEGLSCCTFNEAMTSWGGAYFGDHDNLYGPIGDRPITVDEEPVHNAIRMVRTFVHGQDDPEALEGYAGDISPTEVLQWTEEPSRGPFTDGNAVAHRNWPYSVNINGAEEEMGEDLGVMPIPGAVPESESEYDGAGGPVAALGGWHLVINGYSDRKEAAANVLAGFTHDEVQLTLFEEIGWVPPKPDLFDSQRARDIPVMGRYMDALQVAGENAVPRPVTEIWPSQSESIYQEVHAAYSQDKSPEQAMSDLADSLQQLEEDY